MAGKKIELGPTGEIVRDNIRRLRRARGLGFAELSRELEHHGRPIPPLGLRRIEEGERRVDVDDLTALAVVLWTSPATLLSPSMFGAFTATYTGLGEVGTHDLIAWMKGEKLDPRAPAEELALRARFAAETQPRRDPLPTDDQSEQVRDASRRLIDAYRAQVAYLRKHIGSGGDPSVVAELMSSRNLVQLYDDAYWQAVLGQAALREEEQLEVEADRSWMMAVLLGDAGGSDAS